LTFAFEVVFLPRFFGVKKPNGGWILSEPEDKALGFACVTRRWSGKQTRGQSAKRHRLEFATPETWNKIVVSAL
jgi:hypothetical protein